MQIFCIKCNSDVNAKLTDGSEIYPHRKDLYSLPFWKCDACKGFVGCHHKTKDRTKPLGNIPTTEIRNARKVIHAILDPLWQSGMFKRSHIYAKLSDVLGRQYHTAELKSIVECNLIRDYLLAFYKS